MDRAINRILRRGFCISHVKRSVSSSNVRKMFLDYFEGEHDHLWIPSSPVMPDKDATLAFVNSGMNQFKDVFLGLVPPASGRVVNSQKCIRIRGKHNDLDVVGLDGYHHTFFEMLGNWSFGDYFKKEACSMCWNLLTKVYNIPEDRLYVTYFQGDEALNLIPDTETRDVWAEIGVPQNRILPFGMRDNFWEMASTGPCGPCTEIHYDHDGRADAASLVNTGSPRVTEIWNLVFMEFNKTGKGLEKLGQHFVDTGMGFERLVAVLQGQDSNYETDIFRPLFDVIQKMSGHSGYNGRYDGDPMDTAYRILADHARMLTVALSDGMLPNMQNKVRGIFRKALALSKNTFHVDRGLIKELSNHVAESLSPTYPEIGRNMNKVHYIIEEEEEANRKKDEDASKNWRELVRQHPQLKNVALDAKKEFLNGYHYLKNHGLKDSNGVLSSENAWKLFDTYGVSVPHITEMARILDLKFDLAEYEEYKKDVIKEKRAMNEETFKSEKNFDVEEGIKLSNLGLVPTEDHYRLDYEFDSEGNCHSKDLPVKILSISIDGKSVETIMANFSIMVENVAVVLDKTNCFHATPEMMSDTATLELEGGLALSVYRVERRGNQVVHFLSNKSFPLPTELKINSTGILKLVPSRRMALMRSWAGLHILRTLLSEKVKIFTETASVAGNDEVNISFTSYREKLMVKDVLELETSVLDAISAGVDLKWEMRDVKDIGKIENFTRRPGQTFIDAKIPICTITGRDFTRSYPCPGPVLRNASGLKDLCITSLSKKGYRLWELTAVTGLKAEIARNRGNEFLEKWNHVRDFHVAEFADAETVEERITVITEFVKVFTQYKHIPYYIKHCLREETSNKLLLLQKYIRREIREGRKSYKAWEKS